MKLCIPVCVSFDCQIPDVLQHDPYVLVGCGGYHSSKMMFTDDIGDNISQHNQYVNEMSLIYWISKNYDLIGNPDYIGIAHYRRMLNHEDWMLQPNSIICHAENYGIPIYQSYCFYHVKDDIDFTIKEMQKNFSQNTFESFISFCRQTWNFERNMFIMHKDNFAKYSSFICKFIDIFINDRLKSSDIMTRDRYQKRALGFLLERLTGFWIYDQMTSGLITPVISSICTFNINSPYQRT